MDSYITENFLLQSEAARALYFDYASDLPIIDYHNHLPPQDVAADRQFSNLTEAWLEDDHYKWRAMRSYGVTEEFCTGNASSQEKFQRWADVVPHTVGNPLYHWTHLELKRYFGIDELLHAGSAASVYKHCSELLQTPAYSVAGLLQQRQVELICTTDEPDSSLSHHQQHAQQRPACRMLPTLRLDSLLAVHDGAAFNQMMNRLEAASDKAISTYADLLDCLDARHEFFHQHGCRLSDVGIGEFVFHAPDNTVVQAAFSRLRAGEPLEAVPAAHLSSAILLHMSELNARRGWVQQLHLGALRDANSRKVAALGQGRGFDSIGGWDNTLALRNFLDDLNCRDQLARTVLYNLNPADNAVFSTMAANFNEGDCRGKVQHGAAWWFLDQKQGIEEHLLSISSLGLLSCFVGMVTDSRSFLSFTRHEYFRRILCNFLGAQVEEGLLPRDFSLLGDVVRRVCYDNAREYLPFTET
jgi:glucuronate isomerase